MYNFNTIEKVLKSIGKPQVTKRITSPYPPLPIKSPYCMGACCQMIASSSHIPSVVLKNHNSILPFVKEECPHYLQNRIKLYSSKPTTSQPSLYKKKLFENNNNFIPANRLYSTSINNYKIIPNYDNFEQTNHFFSNNKNNDKNNNYNKNNNNNNKTKIFKNLDNPFLNKHRNQSTKSTSSTSSSSSSSPPISQQLLQQQFINIDKKGVVEKEQSHFVFPSTACLISDHSLISESSEKFKNCVRFETPKSSYVHEIIEGILPKELVSGSRMITPCEPHVIFVNFSSAVKAYQADQYIRQWSEKNLPSLKSMLLRQSLDTFFPYESSKIEKVNNYCSGNCIDVSFTSNLLVENENNYINFSEYPKPKYKLINNSDECEKLITELFLKGKSVDSISNNDQLVLGFDLQYKHIDNQPNTVHFYVLTLSNGENNLILNLDSIKGIPKIVSKIFNSNVIKKVGYPHRRYKIVDFIKLLNWNVNNFENLSTNKIITNSHTKGLGSVVAIFLKLRLPKLEINRFNHDTEENNLFTHSKLQHYGKYHI
ncbi:hypothetical protein RB653_005918 [Dictyostelium firmibasis]|uniref:Uncharacterized protein n=1 Tax=Dictyostelium firmibasis TaxID=79012 RepID=A0AAN7UDH8_9MYCE